MPKISTIVARATPLVLIARDRLIALVSEDGCNCSDFSYYSEREILRVKRIDLHLRITMYISDLKSLNRDVYHLKSRSKS